MSENVNILRGSPDSCSQIPEKSLGFVFFDKLQKYDPNKTLMLNDQNEETSYKDMLELSVRIAKKLQDIGVKEGNVITIISQNHWQYVATTLAGFYIGATVNLLNHDYTTGELQHFLQLAQPSIVFCTRKTLPNLVPLKQQQFYPSLIISYDQESTSEVTNFEKFIEYVDYDQSFTPFEIDARNNVAIILTSSGTTGLPKCVQLTHSNLRITMLYSMEPSMMDLNENEKTINFLPMFHIFGLAISLSSILNNFKLVLMDKFTPNVFLNIIENQKITKLFLVPPILLFLIKSPLTSKYDLSSLKDILCGAAPVSKELENLVQKKLNINSVRQMYGMTEICGAGTIMPKSEIKFGSCGKVCISFFLKVVDPETEKTLTSHQVGEIRFKGKGVMKGYLGNNLETTSAFDQEGYLKSGDLGYFDSDGYVYIVGRLKEIIKYKGFQVSPAELENILVKHPSVKDVAVVGKSDSRTGEVPVAFIVKQPDQMVLEEELIAFVAENVSIQKHLYGGVRFIDEIPRNASGKILRQKLKVLLE